MKSDVKIIKLEQQTVNKALIANVGAKRKRGNEVSPSVPRVLLFPRFQAVAAIAEQSVAIFGQQLIPDPRSDIVLKKDGRSSTLGDIDNLLTGPSLHVHVERKRRLIRALDAPEVIGQMAATKAAYLLLQKHVVGDKVCAFKQVVFAESMESGAADQFLASGIYVLHHADMRLRAPFSK
jgi:hypothetical protein